MVCPGCALACVRTKHPDQQFWRDLRKLIRSARLVAQKFLMVFALTILSMYCLGVTVNAIEKSDPLTQGLMVIPSPIAADVYGIIPTALILIFIGILMRFGFAHVRALYVSSILPLIVSGVFGVYVIVQMLYMFIARVQEKNWNPDLPDSEIWIFLLAFFLVYGMGALGTLAGSYLSPVIGKLEKRKFRRILKKARKRVSEND